MKLWQHYSLSIVLGALWIGSMVMHAGGEYWESTYPHANVPCPRLCNQREGFIGG
jgi:hypothetical protein